MIAANAGNIKQTNLSTDFSPQFFARVAGFLYLMLAPFAIFGIAYVPSLIVQGDIAATINNLTASESYVRLSIMSALFTHIGHICLVLILYKLLSPVNRNHALFMVVFMLVSIPMTMVNELNHFAVLLILNDANAISGFAGEPLHALVGLLLELHEHGIFMAHVFWGLWLLPMGYLVFKSGYIPRIFGIFLMIGCVGYLIDFFTFVLVPGFDPISGMTGWGEILFPLWLLIKGINVDVWEQRVGETA